MRRRFICLALLLALLISSFASSTNFVKAGGTDGDEYFASVELNPFDTGDDGLDDSVEVVMNVDTSNGTVYVTVDYWLVNLLDDSTADAGYEDWWQITGIEVEYVSVYLHIPWATSPEGWYQVVLMLWDEGLNYEDSHSSIVYLYPRQPSPRLVLEEDFEAYNVGSLPSPPWDLHSGYGALYVTDTTSVPPGMKSFCLENPAHAARRFPPDGEPYLDSIYLGFEVFVMVDHVDGTSQTIATVGIRGWQAGWAGVSFKDDETIEAGGIVLASFEADRWYKIQVFIDDKVYTYSVWIDDVLVGTSIETVSGYWGGLELWLEQRGWFDVQAVKPGAPVYFDNIQVYEDVYAEYSLTVSVAPPDAGITNPVPGAYEYLSASSVTVSEAPNSGYVFDHWNLDGANVGSESSYTVYMNAPHTLTAVFVPALVASLSASPTTADVGEEVAFDASASYDPDGTVEFYWFDYGDGSDSGWTSSSTSTHSYMESGVYYAKAKVKDNDGLESGWSEPVEISVGPEDVVLVKKYFPVYKFSAGEEWYPCSFYFDGNGQYYTDLYNKENYDSYTPFPPPYYAYVHMAENATHKTIQYWLYYVWNYHQDILVPEHYSDWDSTVFVILEKTDGEPNPVEISYFFHNTKEHLYWVDWPEKEDTTHPVVYVAEGSHGAYSSPEEMINNPNNRFPKDSPIYYQVNDNWQSGGIVLREENFNWYLVGDSIGHSHGYSGDMYCDMAVEWTEGEPQWEFDTYWWPREFPQYQPSIDDPEGSPMDSPWHRDYWYTGAPIFKVVQALNIPDFPLPDLWEALGLTTKTVYAKFYKVTSDGHFEIYYDPSSPYISQPYLDYVDQAAVRSWERLVPYLTSPYDLDGDGRIEILITNLNYLAEGSYKGALGYCVKPPNDPNGLGMIYIDDNIHMWMGDWKWINSTVSHEFTHMIQFGYDPLEDNWIMEGMAQFGADYVWDTDGQLQRYVTNFANNPDVQLNYPWSLFMDKDQARASWYCASYVFHEFLAEKFGQSIIRTVLEKTVDYDGTEAVEQATGKSFSELFDEFAVWNYVNEYSGTSDGGTTFEGTDIYAKPFETHYVPEYPAYLHGFGSFDDRTFTTDYINFTSLKESFVEVSFYGDPDRAFEVKVILVVGDFTSYEVRDIPLSDNEGSLLIEDALTYSQFALVVIRREDDYSDADYQWDVKSHPNALKVKADSPVNILVTAPNGLRVGYDSVTDGVINEIDGAMYSGPGTEPQVITIPSPLPGAYIVDIFGTGTGDYTITIESVAEDGSVIDTETWTGKASLGELYGSSVQLLEEGSLLSAPLAAFTESDHTVSTRTPIDFDPSSSYDPDGIIVLYEWDFDGDGVYDYSTTTPKVVSHTYTAEGTYTVTLRVTDNDGLTDTDTDTKTITPPGGPTVPEIPVDMIVLLSIAFVAYIAVAKWRRKRKYFKL